MHLRYNVSARIYLVKSNPKIQKTVNTFITIRKPYNSWPTHSNQQKADAFTNYFTKVFQPHPSIDNLKLIEV